MAAPAVWGNNERLRNELALAQAEIDILDADLGTSNRGSGLATGRRTYDPVRTRNLPYESGDIGGSANRLFPYETEDIGVYANRILPYESGDIGGSANRLYPYTTGDIGVYDDDDDLCRPRGRRQQNPRNAAYDDNEELEDLYDEIGELQIVAAQKMKGRQRAAQAQQQAQLAQAGYGYPPPGPYPPPQPGYGYPPPGPYPPPPVQAALQNGQSGAGNQTVVVTGLPDNLQNQPAYPAPGADTSTLDALFIPEDVDVEYDNDGNPVIHRRQGGDGTSANVVNVPDKQAGLIYPEAAIDAFVPLDGDHTFKIEAPPKAECVVPQGQVGVQGPPPPQPVVDANGQLLVPTGRYKVEKVRMRRPRH